MKYKIRPILISTLAGFILPYLFAVTMGSGRINTHEGTGIQVPHFKNSSEQHDFFIKNILKPEKILDRQANTQGMIILCSYQATMG